MRSTLLPTIGIACLLSVSAAAYAEDVSELIAAIRGSDDAVCIEAIDDLTALGADAEQAVPALIGALDRESPEVAWRACRAIGAIGPAAETAVAPLTQALADDNPRVRAYAAFALGRIGEPAMGAVDGLIKNVFDKEEMVRRSSIAALQRIDPPQEKTMPLVVSVLEQGDMSIIMPALHSLAREGKRAVPRLRTALQHEQACYWACLALAEIGPDAAEAVTDLESLLKTDREPDVRLQALVALGEIGKAAQSAVPTILRLVENDPFPNVRYAAVFALGQIGSDDKIQPLLRRLLDSDDEFMRTISAWALARNNTGDQELVRQAVQLIVAAFQSDDVDVRRAAARAAVELDADPELVAPALVKSLQDQDETVVANAIDALSSIGPRALKHIDSALQNKDLRHYAVRLIARLGPEAKDAVPALIEAIGSGSRDPDDREFVREAQFAISTIGAAARDAVPALIKSLDVDDEEIQASASYALGKIGPAARGAVLALRKSMGSESNLVQLASVRALLEIQPGQRDLLGIAAPLLVKALNSDREMVRAEAAAALGEMGSTAKNAIPRIRKLLEDDSDVVRQAAAEALQKLNQ